MPRTVHKTVLQPGINTVYPAGAFMNWVDVAAQDYALVVWYLVDTDFPQLTERNGRGLYVAMTGEPIPDLRHAGGLAQAIGTAQLPGGIVAHVFQLGAS